MADLFATYYYHPRADTTPEHAAQALAEEETTGTWTDISTTTDYIRRLDGVVESVEPHGTGYVTRIRYPAEIFEPGNICLLYTSPSPRDGLLSRMPSSA